jgi:hypothetical protein
VAAMAEKATKPARSMERMRNPPCDPNPYGSACLTRRRLPRRHFADCGALNTRRFFRKFFADGENKSGIRFSNLGPGRPLRACPTTIALICGVGQAQSLCFARQLGWRAAALICQRCLTGSGAAGSACSRRSRGRSCGRTNRPRHTSPAAGMGDTCCRPSLHAAPA